MKAISTICQWLVVLGIGYAIYRYWHVISLPDLPAMPGKLVILFGFSLAFMWVEVMKWGVIKPFNCVKCMGGWLTVIIAGLFHTPFWYFYLPVGLMVGALFTAIKSRWL